MIKVGQEIFCVSNFRDYMICNSIEKITQKYNNFLQKNLFKMYYIDMVDCIC